MGYEVGKRYRYVGDHKDMHYNEESVYVFYRNYNFWNGVIEYLFLKEDNGFVVSTINEDDFIPTYDMVTKRMIKHKL